MKKELSKSGSDDAVVQLKARVPKRMKAIHKGVAATSGIKMEDLAADALRFFYGVQTPELEERRKLAVRLGILLTCC